MSDSDNPFYDYDQLRPREFDAGRLYAREQLPENEMDVEGRPEWVGENCIAVMNDGTMLEFERAYKCTAVYAIREEDGSVGEVYSGEPR